jgi:hypothetical protein
MPRLAIVSILLVLLSACTTTQVKTTTTAPLEKAPASMPEHQLLEVGIDLFDPGLEDAADSKIPIYPEVRQGEARYFPNLLMDSLQRSGHWGAVRVVPSNLAATDVIVKGKILWSDGESLALEVNVSDATGRQWYTRKYKGRASRYAYRKSVAGQDPFQDVYHRIANDMAAFRSRLSDERLQTVRTVAKLRFASGFAPDSFQRYLKQDRKGEYSVVSLPADVDPMMQRIDKIRERDYLFVDTLQDYYGGFSRQMSGPYFDWRERSYQEVVAYNELRSASRAQILGGIAAIIGGIVAAGSSDGSSRAAGQVAVIGGGMLVKSGWDKSVEKEVHVEALQELGESLEAEIAPQVVALEDQTVTLSGTVEDQYKQWRKILADIYHEEVGSLAPLEKEG